jgi:hypothetical protein
MQVTDEVETWNRAQKTRVADLEGGKVSQRTVERGRER